MWQIIKNNWGRILLVLFCMIIMSWNAYNLGYSHAQREYREKEWQQMQKDAEKSQKEFDEWWKNREKKRKEQNKPVNLETIKFNLI